MVLISLFLLTASLCLAQQKTRILDESTPKNNFANPPIAIVSREVGNTPIIDSKILAGSDWLRDLTLTVKNISTKQIVRFEINLKIEKKGAMPYDAGMEFHFALGRVPVLDATGKPTGEYKPSKALKPGETVRVKVQEHQLRILDDIKMYGVGDIDRVLMSIRRVIFDDGSGWFVGIETREDPNVPGSQIPIRPNMPEPRFSKWLRSFALINAITKLEQFVCIFPARSRFFFANSISNIIPAAAPTPDANGCGYHNSGFYETCLLAGQGCTADIGICRWFKERNYPTDNGFLTNFGDIGSEIGSWCVPTDPNGDQGACNVNTGGCGSFEREFFTPDSTCGQPQTCGNTARWGCVAPLVLT